MYASTCFDFVCDLCVPAAVSVHSSHSPVAVPGGAMLLPPARPAPLKKQTSHIVLDTVELAEERTSQIRAVSEILVVSSAARARAHTHTHTHTHTRTPACILSCYVHAVYRISMRVRKSDRFSQHVSCVCLPTVLTSMCLVCCVDSPACQWCAVEHVQLECASTAGTVFA